MKNQTRTATVGVGGVSVGLWHKTLSWSEIKPAKQNDEIYSPVNEESDEFLRLVKSIRSRGLLEPIHVTRDFVIISGHRRYAAVFHAAGGDRLVDVPVVVHENVESGTDEHMRLLVEANSQRVKTAEMTIREAATLADPEQAYERFKIERQKVEERRDAENLAEDVDWSARLNARRGITPVKTPMLDAAIKIINANSKYWPLSVRQVHYRLLNDPPLRNAKKPGSRYANDENSYKDLCDILTRARVGGMVQFGAVSDETRPMVLHSTWGHMAPFVQNDISSLFQGYRRDLLQDQDDFIMVLAEKLTVKTILEGVCRNFCVPMVICRGYPDIGTRHDIAMRFFRSGKRRLVLLFVNDFDPEGWNIPQTVCQSLNEDFHVDWRNIISKRVALTKTDAESLGLAPNFAKETSARYRAFVEDTGSKDSWELEALPPESLIAMVKSAIEECIDPTKFNAQIEVEKAETGKLLALAGHARELFRNSD